MLRFIFTGLVLALFASPHVWADTLDEDRAAMEAISKEWFRGFLEGDIESLMTLYNEESVIVSADRPAARGLVAIEEYYRDITAESEFDMKVADKTEVIDIDGDIAHTVGIYRVSATPKPGSEAEAFEIGGRYWIMFKRQENGAWKVVRDMDNYTPDADVLEFPAD